MSKESDEFDWIFDFVLQFLESDKFDASVMDFIDEKCVYFDSEDENKFIYSEIHKEFKDHVEALISSNLGELGITVELFYESCEKGRHNRDINRAVFERMVAMDDFLTFKKIMVKRNLELQLEAFRSYTYTAPTSSKPSTKQDGVTDEEMHQILTSNLMEMELLNKQRELEQAELEQAMALSLLLEEEKLRLLYEEAKSLEDAVDSLEHHLSSAKAEMVAAFDEKCSNLMTESIDSKYEAKHAPTENITTGSENTMPKKSDLASIAPPKPLKLKSNILGSKPLPSIRAAPLSPIVSRDVNLTALTEELEDKKKQVEETIRASQEDIALHRKEEENLRKQIDTNPDAAELRAQYMREQRDKLIALKKAEREKVLANSNSDSKSSGFPSPTSIPRSAADNKDDSKDELSDSKETQGLSAEEVERRRSLMAVALARRMKLDLIEKQETKPMKSNAISDLDSKLKEVKKKHQSRTSNRNSNLIEEDFE